jgi:hypothetical protein
VRESPLSVVLLLTVSSFLVYLVLLFSGLFLIFTILPNVLTLFLLSGIFKLHYALHIAILLMNTDAVCNLVALPFTLLLDSDDAWEYEGFGDLASCACDGQQLPILSLLRVIIHQTMNVVQILFSPLDKFRVTFLKIFEEFFMQTFIQYKESCLLAFKNRH